MRLVNKDILQSQNFSEERLQTEQGKSLIHIRGALQESIDQVIISSALIVLAEEAANSIMNEQLGIKKTSR